MGESDMGAIFASKEKNKKKKKTKEKMEDGDNKKSGDDFVSMIYDFIKSLPLMIAFFLFIIFMFLVSDFFINNILAKISGTVDQYNIKTTKGELLTGIFLVLGYIIVDMSRKYQIL